MTADPFSPHMAAVARIILGAENPGMSSAHELRFGDTGKVSVNLDSGTWFDHSAAEGGGVIDLIRMRGGIGDGDVFQWFCDHGIDIPDNRTSGSPKPSSGAKKTKLDRVRQYAAEMGKAPGTNAATYVYVTRQIPITDFPADVGCHGRYWHPRQKKEFPALLMVGRDANDSVQFVHGVCLQGTAKAAVDSPKITYGKINGAKIRLPGTTMAGAVTLTEGPEDGLSVWIATGQEVWITCGVSNFAEVPLPDGTPVTIAAQNDPPGCKAANTLRKAVGRLRDRGFNVTVVRPPAGIKDWNDLLRKGGVDAVRAAMDIGASAAPSQGADEQEPYGIDERESVNLGIGSDIEIARRVAADMAASFGTVVYCDGRFWKYSNSAWEQIDEAQCRAAVHKYDGAGYLTPAGEPSMVRLSKSRTDSILHELSFMIGDVEFFSMQRVGINCVSGFIEFDRVGTPSLVPHHPDHRCRHTLPGCWPCESTAERAAGSLFSRLIGGCFKGDADAAEKINMIGEIAGAAALGYSTKLKKPMAIILKGETAENGKSQILDVIRGLLPKTAISSIPPNKFSDERFIVSLASKLLNASDELTSSSAIGSDVFKSVVTGEPVSGRDVYRSSIEFRPVALNIFATNDLPTFRGGMDRGVMRRLLVIPFTRVIPVGERVEGIGRRVATEESDLLLGYAVQGASRLIRRGVYQELPTCTTALLNWARGADPIQAWAGMIDITGDQRDRVLTRDAFATFKEWALAEGYRAEAIPAVNNFAQRLVAHGNIIIKHPKNVSTLVGIRLLQPSGLGCGLGVG